MIKLIDIIKELKLNEVTFDLHVTKEKSEQGDEQITISVIGGGFKENQITLSRKEAEELKKLAEKFKGERKEYTVGVNTPDKAHTQSMIGIKPDGLNCIVSRKEGSTYKGYLKGVESEAGYLKGPQSITYELAEKNIS